MQFQCCQIKHAISQLWKDNIKNFAGNLNNLSIQEYHLIKCQRILNLEKIKSRELCKTHEKNFDWNTIYCILCVAAYDAKVYIFQYKLLSNVLYLDQKLYQFRIVLRSKYFFCDIHDETPMLLFYECVCAQNIWNQI